jgi:hypothetical protein
MGSFSGTSAAMPSVLSAFSVDVGGPPAGLIWEAIGPLATPHPIPRYLIGCGWIFRGATAWPCDTLEEYW